MSLMKTLRRSMKIFESKTDAEDLKWQNWFAGQQSRLESGDEIEPPWIAFPNSLPFSWRQGYREEWKNSVWIPFWQRLSEAERVHYLNRYEPPSEEWRETLTIYWAGKPD